MTDYIQIAQSSPIFSNLSEQEKNGLFKEGKVRHFNKKEFLFHHGDPLLSFYVVCDGAIQIFRNNADGNEKTLEIVLVRDVICSDKIYESSNIHQSNAVAVSNAVVIEFSKIWLKENVKKYGNFALNLLALTANQKQMATLETEHKTMLSAPQIVACFLQKLCWVYNFNPHKFELPFSKKLIASRLGMELETLSRSFLKIKDYGITVSGSKVTIDNFNTIEEDVCDHCSVKENCPMHHNFIKEFYDN